MIETILFSAFGGLLINVLNLWEDTKKIKADRVPKDLPYFMFWVIWPIVGGVLSYVYLREGSELTPFLALSIGVGAPTTIKSMMATATQLAGPPTNAEP